MTKNILASAVFLSLAAGLYACNVHDNTINIPNASLDVKADTDVDNVAPAQSVPLMVTVQNVYLVEPTATPPVEHVEDAGHLEFHLDDEAKPPLLVTAQTNVSVPIPAETPSGHHKIICRVHKHDGTPTDTKFEVSITVKVAVTTTGAGGSTGAAGTGAAGTGGGGAGGAMATTDGGTTTVVVVVDAGVTVTP